MPEIIRARPAEVNVEAFLCARRQRAARAVASLHKGAARQHGSLPADELDLDTVGARLYVRFFG